MSEQNPIPKTMQAIRLHGKSFDDIKVAEVPVPEPNENQLLARVDAAGVCASNLKLIAQGSEHTLMNGWDMEKYPLILGDEGCITVVKAGANVADRFPEGVRFATQPAVDHPPINHRDRYNNAGEGMDKVAIGYTLPGHMADYMLITEEAIAADCLLPLPSDDVPFFAGALCEPFSCVISAQERHVHLLKDSPASPRYPVLGMLKGGVTVVVGTGPMGRMHAEAALRFSPAHLIAVDISQDRLKWIEDELSSRAEQAGTKLHAVLSDRLDEVLKEVSGGRGADDMIIAVGHRGIQTEAQYKLSKGGVLNLFGGLKRGEHIIDLDTLEVHYNEIKYVGSSGGQPSDVAEALRIVAEHEFDPGRHLSMVGSLDRFRESLEKVRDVETEGKIVLYPGIPSTELRDVRGWGRKEELAFLKRP